MLILILLFLDFMRNNTKAKQSRAQRRGVGNPNLNDYRKTQIQMHLKREIHEYLIFVYQPTILIFKTHLCH